MRKLTTEEKEILRKLGSAGGKKAASQMSKAALIRRAKLAAKASAEARKKK